MPVSLTSLDHLGQVLLPGIISISKDSTCFIAEAKFPEEIMQPRSFVGACAVFRNFFKDFGQMADRPNRGLRKDVKPTWHNSSDE